MSILDAVKRYICNAVAFQNVRFGNVKVDGLFEQSTLLGVNLITLASGNTSATLVILTNGFTDIVTSNAANNAVKLPLAPVANGAIVAGGSVTVRNDSTTPIQVFPASVNSTINSLGANNPYILQPGDQATFIAINGLVAAGVATTTNYITTTNSLGSGGPSSYITPAAGALVIAPTNIGVEFLVPAQGAPVVYTLPSVALLPLGSKFYFLMTATAAFTITFTPFAGDLMTGGLDFAPATIPLLKNGAVNTVITAAALAGTVLVLTSGTPGAGAWNVSGWGGSAVASFA